jgi:regulator of sigma E protease
VRIGDEPVRNWGNLVGGLYEAEGQVSIELVDPAGTHRLDVPADEAERRVLASSIDPWVEAGVGMTMPGSPAEEAGLEAGDRITAVAGAPVENWWDLVRAVGVEAEEERRDGRTVVVGKIGIGPPSPEMTYTDASVGQAVVHGYRETIAVAGVILGFLRDLVTGGISPRSVGSIVTIGEASGQAAQAGFDQFLRFMALFSVNLAVLNLLPIPVLDGGHLVFLGIETVRGGRGLSAQQRLAWSNVGFLIIVGIMIWALGNDFLRLLGL